MSIFKRTILRIAALLLIFGVMFGILVLNGSISIGAQVDAVTKATGDIVYADDIDGSFTVLINKDMHKDAEALAEWITFFSGGEVGVIFEDVTCYVASNDPSGLEAAESFQSRLPENQLMIKTVPSGMLVDKAAHGVFDVIVLSDPIADTIGADKLFDIDTIEVIHI
ncbi:MAG: hypothetical protein IJV48_07680 [Ruminococcus sp.]|nr:hypothetical protein [Ruminococcus sp.]